MPLDRRQFIKLTAVTGTTAALAGCGNPENHIVRFIPEDELVPGVAVWKPSICPLCAAGCGVLARVMEGDAEVFRNGQPGVIRMGLAKKLEGNPRDPISQGKLCARGQAAIQVTYHPDRIANPLKRSGARGTGQYQDITWDEAIAELVANLDKLSAANQQASLACLTRARTSHRQALVAQFLTRFGAPPPVVFEMFSDDVLRRANRLSFDREQVPTIDLARARYVISFGADFLGTWNSPVAQGAAYGRMRQGSGVRGTFVQVEARMSQTGANADQWVPARPGTEGVLALGLAHVILAEKLRPSIAGRATTLVDGWSAGLPDYAPAAVEQRTGVRARTVERLARSLAAHTPAVAIIGGAALAQTNGMFHALAVNALNALLGSVGVDGGIRFTAPLVPVATGGRRALRDALAPAANVQVLLIDDANPVFAAPRAWQVRETLQKIPFIASFGSFLDETSVHADLILPDHSFLESWVDALPESGSVASAAGVAGPVMRPLYDTRATPDVLIAVAGKLAKPLSPPLPASFEQMLQGSFNALGEDVWAAAIERGGFSPDRPAGAAAAGQPAESDRAGGAARSGGQVSPVGLEVTAQFDGDAGQYPFHFLPYSSPSFLDGSTAHLPWLQELPDPMTSAMWSSWIEINEQTAGTLQIAAGDLVEVTSQHGSLRAPAVLSPGVAPDVIAMPAGQGHETFTRYASGRGANAASILAPAVEPETGALAWAATRVKIARVSEDGGLILFAGATRERPERKGR